MGRVGELVERARGAIGWARKRPPVGEAVKAAGGRGGASEGYRTGAVPLGILKKMRVDPQIALGLSAVKAPIAGAGWWAASRNEDAARFVEAALRPLWPELVRIALSAVDFGFVAAEKVWEIRDVEYEFAGGRRRRRAAVYRKVRDLDPEAVTLTTGPSGGFAGVRTGGAFLPPEKCFVMTLGKEFGDLCGRSRLEAAYEPWYWASVMYMFANRYFERKGDPPIIGTAPCEERVDSAGNRVKTLDEAARVIASLRSGGTAVFPDERDERGNARWDFRYLVDDKRADMFISYIEHLQVMKLRAILVPERVLTQDTGAGSYAMAGEHTETFLRNAETLLAEVLEHVNRYVVRPLVEFNFGRDVEVRIESSGVRRKNEALLKEILFKVIDAEAGGKSATAGLVDSARLLEQLNIASVA